MRIAFLHPYAMADHFFVEAVERAAIADLVALGHDAEAAEFLFDPARPEGEQLEELREALGRERYDLVFLERAWSDELVRALDGVKVVAWSQPELVERGLVDVALESPGRATACALVQAIATGESLDRIPGATFRDGDAIRRVPGAAQSTLRELGDAEFDHRRRRILARGRSNERRAIVAANLGCAYRNAPNRTGVLDGVELPPSVSTAGCTFCDEPAYERMTEADAIGLIVRQVRAVLRDRPEVREIAIKDDYAIRFLCPLGDALRPLGLGDREILLSSRADYLPEFRADVEAALAGRFPSPIGFYLVGFENFSQTELDRFHKGISAAQMERVLLLTREWTMRFPGRFRLTPTGGFILFTPWTTLEDLRANANAMRQLGFERFRGRALLSQLRLYPNVPLYWLAKRDGLLLERFDRADASHARRCGYEPDCAYRFREPKVAEIHEKLLDARELPDAELFALFEDALDAAAGIARGAQRRADRLVRAPRDARHRGPATLQVSLNRSCNQNCGFCNARGPEVEPPRARAARAIHAIRAAAAQGVRTIVLTGAEPLLEWYLKDLAKLAGDVGIEEIAIETNGTLLDAHGGATALIDAGIGRAIVAMPHADERLADAITRDPGGHARTVAGIRALRDAGIAVELSVPILASNRGALAALADRVETLFGGAGGRPAIEGIVTRWISRAPDARHLLDPRGAAREIVAGVRAAATASLPLRLAPGGDLPPCVFDDLEEVQPVLRLGAAIVEREAHQRVRIAACARCSAKSACPGVAPEAAALIAREAHPLDDDARATGLVPVSDVRRRALQEYRSQLFQQTPEGVLERRIVRLNFHCNQACDFCFVSRDLPAIEHELIVREIEAAGARGAILDLSGGEPTLNPRVAEYIALARARGIARLDLQTNAIKLADRSFAQALFDAGLRSAFVSLHGVRAESSDRVTAAPGTFVKTVEGIRNLLELGATVHLNFVLCGYNVDDLAALPDFVAREFASGLRDGRLGLTFSFVAASTDNVPRDRKLIPRLTDVAWAFAAAHEQAIALGIEIHGFDAKCGVPACYLPRTIRERHFAGDIPAEELARNGATFARSDACARCELRARCYGVRASYAELHGVDELRPIVGGEVATAARLPATAIHRGSVWHALGLAASHTLRDGVTEALADDAAFGCLPATWTDRVGPLDRELLQLRSGLRALIKAERRSVDEAEAAAESYRAQGFLSTVFRGPAGPGGSIPRAITFVARTRAVLDEALAIEPGLTSSDDERVAHVRRMGELLGYPACCVDLFARAHLQDDPTHIERLARAHRGRQPLEQNWAAVVTLRLFSHYPCEPACAATGRLARATLDALASERPEAAAEFERALRSVVLVQAPDRFAVLVGAKADGGDAWRYEEVLTPRNLGVEDAVRARPLAHAFWLEIASRLAEGNRVVRTPSALFVERDGRALSEIRFAVCVPPMLDFTGPRGGGTDRRSAAKRHGAPLPAPALRGTPTLAPVVAAAQHDRMSDVDAWRPRMCAVVRVTDRCNQACVFCCQAGRAWVGDPSLDEVKRDLADLRAKGVDTIVFMQGETLLRPDVEAIVRYAHGLGFAEVGVATNGTRLADRRFLERILSAGLGFVELSIHSHRESVAAEISGRNATHALQRRALENLAAVGDRLTVRFNTVLGRENAGELPALLGYLLGYVGAPRFAMTLKFPFLRGRANEGSLLRYADVDLSECLAVVDERDLIVILENFPLCLVPGSEHRVLKAIDLVQSTEYFSRSEHEHDRYGRRGQYLHGYAHVRECDACSLREICPGPDVELARRFDPVGVRAATRPAQPIIEAIRARFGGGARAAPR